MLTQRNLEFLTKSEFLRSIVSLKLPRNNLGNALVAFLFSSETKLSHIKKLDLSSNQISEDGAICIQHSSQFPHLEVLDLRINKLGNNGLKFLVESPNYPSLHDLRVDMNKIEEKGAQ